MRSTSSLAVLVVLGVAAGCSRDKPAANPRLDLVLGDNARGTPVVSALELGGEAKATPAARTSSSGVVANVRATHRARTRHVASVPRPRRAPEPEPMAAPAPQPVAAAPAPTPAAEPAAAPANRPDPDPAP